MRVTLVLLLVLSVLLKASNASAKPFERIFFGSCGHQDKDMPILDSVVKQNPDLFIFLGDNVYGDTEDMSVLQAKYEKLGSKPRFQALKDAAPIIAIWDDHDYGENDAGAEYPQKEASRQIMLDFWGEPKSSERRTREDGIYTSYIYGDEGQRVQVILPDLRWNRPEINQVSTLNYFFSRKPDNLGPYKVHADKSASMLGEKQWQWLERELQKPADIRIIGSSLQVLADFTGWEAWRNFPADIARLKSVINKHKVNGVLLISGDTHWGEISRDEEGVGYPLWDVTSSGLTQEWKDVSPNRLRLGDFTSNVNFGAIEIDWKQEDPLIRLGLHDVDGRVIMQHRIRLSSISHP